MRRIALRAPTRERAEVAAAEAYTAGAVGLEERDGEAEVTFWLYAPAAASDAVRAAAAAVPGCRVAPAVDVPDRDWSQAWKVGLHAIEVSPRLVIRPSFVAPGPGGAASEVVIDPEQAFGTGAHVSTLLALEWIDGLAEGLKPGARLLDVGTGSGVLALAALRLGWSSAVGLDLDPLATAAARENARRNGVAGRLELVTGGPASLARVGFDLVVANLLRRELLPILGEIAARLGPGAPAVLSGLLADERPVLERALAAEGLRIAGERRRDDPDGVGWCALLTAR